ncbi:MAG: hypothetical protein KF773_21780 [Deltaproteobacteria bacterium]|nr:hypothetical protein [Deltaproteobacteria bacterium]
MRLGTCVALELAVAAGAIGGVWFGVGRAGELADEYFTTQSAAAASATPEPPRPQARPLPAATLEVAHPPVEEPVRTVFGAPDEQLLAPIAATPLKSAKLNRGGTSLTMRLEFASGARASFKPEQTFPQSDPRREIAAHRMDRLLRIGHVPPVKVIKVATRDLYMSALPDYKGYTMDRIEEEGVQRQGFLHGSASWWIPEIVNARLGPFQIDEPHGRAIWQQHLQVGAKIPAGVRSFVEQIATCIVFDVLIDNGDRWSGNNTQMSPDGKTLYFMDNTLSFSIARIGSPLAVDALQRIQVFPRGLVRRARELTKERIVFALGTGDGLGRLLGDVEINAILARRDFLVGYVDGLISKHGEDAVLVFP